MSAGEMKHRNEPRAFKTLAIALSALVLALPLLGLNCEMACARGGARTATSEGPAPAQHCPAHSGSSPNLPSNAPQSSDTCGHHADPATVKKAVEGAGPVYKVSIVGAAPSASAENAFCRSASDTYFSAPGSTPRPPAALPRVLRL